MSPNRIDNPSTLTETTELRVEYQYMVWVDVETTGLDPRVDCILEVAVVVTTQGLEVLAAEEVLVQPFGPGLKVMSQFVRDMHTKSGLLAELASPSDAMSFGDADEHLHDWLQWYAAADDLVGPLCGSSVHFDRAFLAEWMPRTLSRFTHRNIDISGLREAARRWAPHLDESIVTNHKHHRAYDDALDAIELARFYKRELFRA